MGLALFSAKDVRTEAQKRQEQDLTRASSLRDLTAEIIKEHNEAEASFREALKRQKITWEAEEALTRQRRDDIKKEVETLEAKRRKALRPQLLSASDVLKAEKMLDKRENALEEQREDLEERERELMSRLDDISTREQDARDLESLLTRRKAGIEAQGAQTASEARKMAVALSGLLKREEELKAKENELEARRLSEEATFREYEQRLEEREKEIEVARLLLEDRRKTLDRAWTELRRKQNGANARIS